MYSDVELPYPDAKVAEKLCLGGPCFYLIDTDVCEDVAMMNQFILSHVLPNVKKRLPDAPTLVLGKAVLWLLFSSHANKFEIPNDCIQQVKMEWRNVQGGDNNEAVARNPIKRVPVQVNGNQGVVFIDELPDITLDGAGDGGGVVRRGGGPAGGMEALSNQVLTLQSSVMTLRRDNHDLQTEIGATRLAMECGFFDCERGCQTDFECASSSLCASDSGNGHGDDCSWSWGQCGTNRGR